MKLEETFKRSSIKTVSGKNQIKDVAINTILKTSESMKVGPINPFKMDRMAQGKQQQQQQLRMQWMSDKFKSPIINY